MKATLSFISDLPIFQYEKPYELWLPPEKIPDSLSWTNTQFSEHPGVEIKDIRSNDTDFGYETTGFKYLTNPLSQLFKGPSWPYNDSMVQEYLTETVELVRKEFSAKKVLCFDWRYRKVPQTIETQGQRMDYQRSNPSRKQALEPAQNVHIDDSPLGGRMRLKRHLTDSELKDFEDGLTRIRIVNFWRPIVHAVKDWPLTLCDRRTVPAESHILCDKVHPDFISEGSYVKYSPSYHWYWLSDQTMNEPVVFVSWDSKSGKMPSGTPHAAFYNPDSTFGDNPRESIEVRLMVLTKNSKEQ